MPFVLYARQDNSESGNQPFNHFNNFEVWYWTSGLGTREPYKAMKIYYF